METLSVLESAEAGVSVARLTTTAETEAMLRLFAAIAEEQGWQPGGWLDSVPDGAVHFALCIGSDPIGGLQLVLPDSWGKLPCQRIWPEATLPEAPAHVTVLGLLPEHRGNPLLFWSLCQALWCYCTDRKVRSLVLEATPRMEALYRRMGLPLKVIGGLREHWGEPCLLAAVDIVAVAGETVLRARRSELFRRLVLNALQDGA